MSIVCGTTLASEDRELAELAAGLAARLALPLRLVHVAEDPRAAAVLGTDEERHLGAVRAALEAEAARVQAGSGVAVQVHLAAGTVPGALVSVAGLELATALVVGGTSRAGHGLVGQTAERAARKSAVPVLAVREPARLRAWLEGARPLRILVGADAGGAAQQARAFAAGLRAAGPCEVVVAWVVTPREVHARLGLPPPGDDHALAPAAEHALRGELARAAPATEADAALRVIAARGGADARLVTLADEGDFDLVVVGQRRRSMIEQLWYGSVARAVLRAAPVSVACVPPPVDAAPPAFRAPRVVVVATALDEVSARALAQALGLAEPGGAVHLAHVVPALASPTDARAARDQAWDGLTRLALAEAQAERPLAIECHVLEGAAAEQLLALAARVSADLIVLGARGRSTLGRLVLGSVSREVADRAPIPVLLVPPGGS